MIKIINKKNPAAFMDTLAFHCELTKEGKVYNRNYFFENVLISSAGTIKEKEHYIIFCYIFTDVNDYEIRMKTNSAPKTGKDIAFYCYNYFIHAMKK